MNSLKPYHIDRLKAILWEYRDILPSETERMLAEGELLLGEVEEYIRLLCHDPLKQHVRAYMFSDEIEEQAKREAYRRRVGKTIIFLQMAKASAKTEGERASIEEQIKQYRAVMQGGR